MTDPRTEQTSASNAGHGRMEGADSGGSDLDSLLKEYEEGTKAAPRSKPSPDLSKLDPVIKFAEAEMTRRNRESVDKDVDSAVDTVSGMDAFKGLPKTLVRRMLIAHAFDNASFDEAFQQRGKNPKLWNDALTEAGTLLAEEIKDLPRDTGKDRDDIEAAKATVNGTRQTGGDDDDDEVDIAALAGMSDVEWRRYVDGELAKAS